MNSSTTDQQGQMNIVEAIAYLENFFLMYDLWRDAARIISISRPRRAGPMPEEGSESSVKDNMFTGYGVNDSF